MDDFGDYIYLIVIAIAALTSILGKKKKREAEGHSSTPEMPSLDDVLTEYSDNDGTAWPFFEESKQPVKVKQPQQVVAYPTYDNSDDFSVMRAKKQVVHNQMVHSAKHFVGSELTLTENDDFNVIELDTADDVKRAFIYSEVFQRKY